MATSSTHKLIQIIQEGQAQMLDYLKRADERGERQSRATLKALAAIQDGQKALHDGQKALHDGQKALHDGQKVLAQMLSDMQAITVRSLELTREIHETVTDKKSSRH
jgi:hypothetical protein